MILALRVALAVVFTVAAIAKLADIRATFGVRFVLPVFELTAAALLVLPGTTLAGAVLALVLLAGFTGWVARDPSADCDCFGRLARMPGPLALLRNAVLLIVAGAVALSALLG